MESWWLIAHSDRGGGGAGRAIALPLFYWDLFSRGPVDMEKIPIKLLDFALKGGQGTKVAAVSGQRLENLSKETLTKTARGQSFDHFYGNVSRKSEGLLGEPTLPRKRCTSARLEVGACSLSYP